MSRVAGWAAISLGLVACYSPSLSTCTIRCSQASACPAGATCQDDGFCHRVGDPGDSCASDDGSPPQADARPDARLFDAAPCSPLGNDHPSRAEPIGAGETCVEFSGGGGSFHAACNPTDGRELFFELDLPIVQIVYADSFNSTGPTTISAWNGPCSTPPGAPLCFVNGTCGEPGARAAARLGPGPACLVVEEASPLGVGAIARLNVIPTGTDGIEGVAGSSTIDTCTQTADFPAGACTGAGPEGRWYIPSCPSGINVTVNSSCSPDGRTAHMIPRFTVPQESGDLGCAMGVCGTSPPGLGLGGGGRGLVWFIIDGPTSSDCGPTTLNVTFN